MSLLFYLNNFLIQAKETKKVIMKEIIELEDENRKLDARIVKGIKFKLAKEQNVGGNTEKYILYGNDSNRWLFKIYSCSTFGKESMVVSRLSAFFGIKTPAIYEIELVINKKSEYGSLQKMLPNVKVWDSSFVCNISPEQIMFFQKQHVLDWLIYNGEVEGEEFLLDTKTGEIIAIDRDEVFCSEDYEEVKLPNKERDLFWYNEFFKEVSSNGKKIDCIAVFEMIDYIQSIEDDRVENILKDVFGKRVDYYLKKILPKKHNLRRDFEKFYQELSLITGKNIGIPPPNMNNNYAKTVLANMKEEVLNKKESIIQIELDRFAVQEDIEVISSKDAWYLLYYKLKYASKDEFLLRAGEVSKKLEKLKDETRSVNERYVINLYINQIEKIKQLLEMKNIKINRFIKRITIHPLFKNLLDVQNQRINYSPPEAKKNGKNGEKILMNKILCLFNESQKLDKKIVKKLRFELCKNQYLKGSTHKYLFKSNNGDLWMFKIYPFPNNKKVKISRCVYLLAQLLGISTPVLYEINLPINGKLCYGSIQKFIFDTKELFDVKISELSNTQIEDIQCHEIFDWLIFNRDPDSDHFFIKPKTDEIVAIDKDLSLSEMKVNSLGENSWNNPWNNAYYTYFWKGCIIEEINIGFKKAFNFIEYIQNIKDCKLRKILLSLCNKNKLIDEFFLQKKNLKVYFKKNYSRLSVLQGKQFLIADNADKKAYSKLVLEKIKNIVIEKRQILNNLKAQKKTRQNNITVISSKEAWDIVDKLNYVYKEWSLEDIKDAIEKLEFLEKKNVNIHEKLAINLYIEEVRKKYIKKIVENFPMRKEIELITMHPHQINDRKIFNWEYNLRAVYKDKIKSFWEHKGKFRRDYEDIFLRLDSILHSVWGNYYEKKEFFLREYKNRIEKDPLQLKHRVLYGTLLLDLNYLEKINDGDLKYLGMALVWGFKEDRDEIIRCCNKAISLNENNFVAYKSYMLLGLICEHNKQWQRFGEGFELEKSIGAYKKAAVINPESVGAHLNLGILYLIMKNGEKALNEFKIVNKLDAEYGRKHFHFDRIKERNSYRRGKEYLEAVRMNTLSGRYHYVLGLAYRVNGQVWLEQKHFNKACEFGYKDIIGRKNVY